MNEEQAKRHLQAFNALDWEALVERIEEAKAAADGDREFLAEEMVRIQEEFGLENIPGLPDAADYKNFIEQPSNQQIQELLKGQARWNMATDQQLNGIATALEVAEQALNDHRRLLRDILKAAAESPAELQKFAAEILTSREPVD